MAASRERDIRPDLSEAALSGAILTEADLSEADLSAASLGDTVFGSPNLIAARELETCTGPSNRCLPPAARSAE